jgi:hypothetical protein
MSASMIKYASAGVTGVTRNNVLRIYDFSDRKARYKREHIRLDTAENQALLMLN